MGKGCEPATATSHPCLGEIEVAQVTSLFEKFPGQQTGGQKQLGHLKASAAPLLALPLCLMHQLCTRTWDDSETPKERQNSWWIHMHQVSLNEFCSPPGHTTDSSPAQQARHSGLDVHHQTCRFGRKLPLAHPINYRNISHKPVFLSTFWHVLKSLSVRIIFGRFECVAWRDLDFRILP